jgi:serine/threonine-protein kinase RsbW
MNASPSEPAQPDLFRHVTAGAEQLIELRRALTTWAAALRVGAEQLEDMILASYEAMANSAAHAYRGGPDGSLDLHAAYRAHEVTVTITDYGTWKSPDPADEFHGRGLVLIEGLSHDSRITHRADGTTVTMTWQLDPEPARMAVEAPEPV